MSSHREAPAISKDPVADSTDLYAFRSPDNPDTVTLIANYVPLEAPAGGPNFYEFGDDVLYEILVDNDADAEPDVVFQFRFHTVVNTPGTFLYNTGQVLHLNDATWNRRQFFSVRRLDEDGNVTWSADNLACPPVNVGPRSMPNYGDLAQAAIHVVNGDFKIFAGQRREAFFVDLGSIFDLGVLRPFEAAHLISTANADGVDTLKSSNVHTIAIQVPITSLTKDGFHPGSGDVEDARSVLGVWTRASRRRAIMRNDGGDVDEVGPWVQVSRLGNPLINEVVIAMGDKDQWNSIKPEDDSQFLKYYQHPQLSGLLPVLYPGKTFANLAAINTSFAVRADIVAILATGIPSGVIPHFQNSTGSTVADMLRLNVAIPPASSPSPFGILGGDLAGFPNGRRVPDDVVTIELRALAGATYGLVASYTPDAAAGAIFDVAQPTSDRSNPHFPYLADPLDGFTHPSS